MLPCEKLVIVLSWSVRLLQYIVLICIAAPAVGQDFAVVGSSPIDGDMSVDTVSTVVFTFSAPIDTTHRFSSGLPVEFFAINPADSISIDSVYYSGDRHSVLFDVRHTDNTDFVWILTGARTAADTLLCSPYAVNYSTASNQGPWSVGGTAAGLHLVKRPDCTIVALVPVLMDDIPERAGHIVAADVTGQELDFQYEIDGVRNGVYWPAVLADIDRDGIIEPTFWRLPERSMYDDDGDQEPDSIVVSDSSLTQINLVILVGLANEPRTATGESSSLIVYPNPSNHVATVDVVISDPAVLRIGIVDVLGRTVLVLRTALYHRGQHSITFDTSRLRAGMYLVQLRSGHQVESARFVVAR